MNLNYYYIFVHKYLAISMILFWLIRRVVKLDVCLCVVGITVTNDGPGKGAKIKRLRGREKKLQKLWDESYQCIVGKKVLLSFAFAFVFVATFLRRLSDWFVRWLWWLHRSTAVRYTMILFVCVCMRRSLRLQFCVFLSRFMQNTLKCVVGRDNGDSKRKLNCFDTFVNVWCCGVAQWWCDGDDSLVTVIQLYFDSVVTPINAISFICFCYSVLIILFICVNTFTKLAKPIVSVRGGDNWMDFMFIISKRKLLLLSSLGKRSLDSDSWLFFSHSQSHTVRRWWPCTRRRSQ